MSLGRFKFNIKDIKSLFRRKEKKEAQTEAKIDGGVLCVVWGWCLPVFTGWTIGWFCMVCVGVLMSGNGAVITASAAPSAMETSKESGDKEKKSAFLVSNPFHISTLIKTPEVKDKPAEAVVTGSLARAVLKGTLPNVGAWMEEQGTTRLILLNTSFDIYTLKKVTSYKAIFVNSGDLVVKELLYVDLAKPPAGSNGSSRKADVSNLPVGTIVSAAPDGEPGQVPSGLVSQLVENPFDELKRVRLRPAEEGTGLEIQWIQDDSILKQLGVQKGDVIRSINGIPFKNMADIANSINSLMNSERFDVDVSREGKPTSLRYVVH